MEAHAGEYIRKYLHVKRFPRISLVCKLVPVQHREYEYGLFAVELECHNFLCCVSLLHTGTSTELFRVQRLALNSKYALGFLLLCLL